MPNIQQALREQSLNLIAKRPAIVTPSAAAMRLQQQSLVHKYRPTRNRPASLRVGLRRFLGN